MKHVGIIVLCLLTTLDSVHSSEKENPFFSMRSHSSKTYIFHIPHPEYVSHFKNLFFNACFDFPQLLEKAAQKNIPIILAIPEQYFPISTTEQTAPAIEGARIALAWASAFYRFRSLGNVDIRTVLIPQHTYPTDIVPFLLHASQMHFKNDDILTPEEKMAQRLINAKDLSMQKDLQELQIKPLFIQQPKQSKHIITPKAQSQKTIVITGVAGFLGSYLAQAFLEKDFAVIGIDNFACSTGENLAILHAYPHFEFYELDVSQPFNVEGPVDFIAHLASIPSPADYYKMPIETLRSGLHGAHNALMLAAKKNARILLASSSEVYGNPEMHPQHESYKGNVNPIAMRSQYDESKRGEETLAKLFYDAYGIDIRIARIFNTFGPRMRLSDGRVMTNFIQAVLNAQPMIVHGDGTQTRSPTFVTDTINGLVSLLESESITPCKTIEERIFNVGTPHEYSINEIAIIVNKLSEKHLRYTVPIQHVPHIDPTDPKVRRPDITLLAKATGFQPTVTFEDGLEIMFLHYLHAHNHA